MNLLMHVNRNGVANFCSAEVQENVQSGRMGISAEVQSGPTKRIRSWDVSMRASTPSYWGQLYHHDGFTYALTKMWGSKTLTAIGEVQKAFPEFEFEFSPVGGTKGEGG